MSLLEGGLLGIVQGLTELPVEQLGPSSSSPSPPDRGVPAARVTFDVMLRVGTAVASLHCFRQEIRRSWRALLPEGVSPVALGPPRRLLQRRLLGRRYRRAARLVVATAITSSIGLRFKDVIDLFESVELAAAMLLVTGILLFLSDRVKNRCG